MQKDLTSSSSWWIAGLVLHRYDLGWLVPFLVWFGFSIRLLTLYVSTRPLSQALARLWRLLVTQHTDKLRRPVKLVLGAAVTAAIILTGTFGSAETPGGRRADRAVGLFGLVVFLSCAYALSKDRKNINFQAVLVALLMQFLLALFVLRSQAGVSRIFLGSTIKAYVHQLILGS